MNGSGLSVEQRFVGGGTCDKPKNVCVGGYKLNDHPENTNSS